MALVRKELVRPAAAQLSSDEAYRFRHLLIRDAAYGSLPKAVRAELHERLAAWLDERDADQPELDELAGYHLEQAARYRQELGQPNTGMAQRASGRLATAGRRALWRGDERAARALLERALTLLRPIRLDVDLELDLVDAQPSVHDVAAMADAVADQAASAGDQRGEAVASVVAARYRLASAIPGSVDELEVRARQVLPLLNEADDHSGLVRVWHAVSGVARLRGRFEEATQAVEQAIFHARQIGQPGLFDLAFELIVGPRPTDQALRTLDSLLPDDPHPNTRLDRAVLLAMLGRFEEARLAANEASARLYELTGGAGAEGPMADIETLAGDHERAAYLWRVCCDGVEQWGWRASHTLAVLLLARSLCMLGQHDEAGTLAQRGRELGGEQYLLTQTLSRQVQALVQASRGQHGEAELLAREAVAIAERTDGLRWQGDAFCDLAEILVRAGRSEEATTVLERALDRYQRKRNLAMVAHVRQRLGTSEDGVPLA